MSNGTMVLLVAAGAVLLGRAGSSGGEEMPLAERLMALENGAMERWRQGDPMGWAEISAPEVTYVDPVLTAPIVGLEAYTAYLEALKGKVVYQGSEYLNPKVAVYGDVAVMTYNYRSRGASAAGAVREQTLWNATEVYARFGEAWRIIHTHWSYVGHEPPEQLEIPLPVAVTARAYEGVLGELMTLEARAMERWRTGDPFGFTDISDAAVTYFDSSTPRRLDGLAALKGEYAKVAGKVSFAVMDFIAPAAEVHGDAAVLLYRFLSTRLRPDGSVERRTPWTCTEVYARRDGAWRIVHTHWSHINGRVRGAAQTAE